MNEQALIKVIEGTKEERVYLCSLSFGLFALYYFQHYFKYSLADYQKDFINDFEEITDCKIRELILITFREGAKTSTAKLYLIWLIAYKKRLYVNIDSFDRENAERILFDIAYELTNNKRLRADFGLLFSKERGISDVKQNRINNFITENGIRVEAHSTGESVRGRLHLNQRPDLLLLDDFENNRTKVSKAHTDQIRDHITEAMGGLAENGVIIYLANYLSEFGNVQFLIDRSKKDPMIRLRNIPIVIDGKPAWDSKYCLTDEENKLTGKKSIESMMRQFGSYVFSYEFMNQPVDSTMSEFKQEFATNISQVEVDRYETRRFVTIDTAVSEKASADYTGVVINYVDFENKWNIKAFRVKFNPKDLIDFIFTIWRTVKPETIGIEKTIYLQAIKPFLDEEMRLRNTFIHITELSHSATAKETRIRGLIPRWESKSIKFIENECNDLKEEMLSFPHGKNDDVIDALAYQNQIAQAPHRESYDEKLESYNMREARLRNDAE